LLAAGYEPCIGQGTVQLLRSGTERPEWDGGVRRLGSPLEILNALLKYQIATPAKPSVNSGCDRKGVARPLLASQVASFRQSLAFETPASANVAIPA
jgi:hypothetical protein